MQSPKLQMLTKSEFSKDIPAQTATELLAAIDDVLSASSSTDAAELCSQCLSKLPFKQATLTLEVVNCGRSLGMQSTSTDHSWSNAVPLVLAPLFFFGTFFKLLDPQLQRLLGSMTCICEARGHVFTIRISVYEF